MLNSIKIKKQLENGTHKVVLKSYKDFEPRVKADGTLSKANLMLKLENEHGIVTANNYYDESNMDMLNNTLLDIIEQTGYETEDPIALLDYCVNNQIELIVTITENVTETPQGLLTFKNVSFRKLIEI